MHSLLRLLHRVGLATTIYGKEGEHDTPYLTRVYLSPLTRWGSLRMHIFWRGDQDPDLHDHPFDFVTLPLTSYMEITDTFPRLRVVERFKLHRRPAEYRHRVLKRMDEVKEPGFYEYGPPGPKGWRESAKPIYTLLWISARKRDWGFWVTTTKGLEFVPWRDYVYGETE